MFDASLLPSVLSSAPDAILVVDDEGVIRYANLQVTTLFGYPLEEVVGQRVELLMPEHIRAAHVGHRRGFLRTLDPRPMGSGRELFGRRKNGSLLPVEISLSPIGGGARSLVAAAIRDATERRQVEAALKQARAEAERAMLAKSRFLAAASHDLRQPLQALALLNGTLRRLVTDADARDAIEQQADAISMATRLLRALLDISKLESGALVVEVTDFELSTVLEELRDEFRVVAEEKGIDFRLEVARVRARTDRTLLMQALRNLVANALKYTDRGTVTLRSRRDGESVCVDVMDTGIGIEAEHLDHIFDEFFQVGSKTHTSRQGYGLGLSIVDRIVHLLDLRIAVESKQGQGSCFSLRLPAGVTPNTDASVSTGARAAERVSQADRQILLVEDDPSVRKATQLFLKSEGFRVAAAASLAQALDMSGQLPAIDLLITDYHLEHSRGTDVISALRARFGNQLPSILMTGDTSSAIKELPHDSQLRIISKPIDADELLELIGGLIPPVTIT